MRRVAVIGVLVLALAGCATERTVGPGDPTGVVRGDVLAGPTCPVEPTDGTGCEPAPVAGMVQFLRDDTSIGEVSIREDGTFSADVPVGSYTAHVVTASTNGFPVCTDAPVTVTEGASTELHLQCDTGIR